MKKTILSALLGLSFFTGCGGAMEGSMDELEGQSDPLPEIGKSVDPIARGVAVADGVYPWAVSLHTSSATSNSNTLCSGSHVAPGWVLTAQHCFDHNLDGVISAAELSATEVWASLNRTKISLTTRGEVIQGAQVFLYGTNDLALLRLARPSSAPLVQLANALPAVNTPVTTAGWGYFTTTNSLPDNLQQGSFKVSGSSAVDLNYINVNTEEMCGGDSGGPVFTQSGGVTKIVAAHTNSPGGCGISVGAATGSRVDTALAWVRSIVHAQYGFVWANQSATASYAPSASYSFNSTGGANMISRSSAGVYRVSMPGLGQSNGNVQVVAYGATSNRCKVSSWIASGSTMDINVRCFTAAGAAADTMFVAQYYRAGSGNAFQGAYLWANSPASAAYTPSAFYSHNSKGGINSVTRSSVGTYQASLPGFTSVGGNVQITAYGGGTEYCKVASWGVSTVNVRCYNTAGALVDAMWTLRYTDKHVANDFRRGAYAWANDALSPAYTPSVTYSFHSLGSALSAARSSVGQYSITLPSLAASNKTSVMVTAYGSTNNTCHVSSWLASGTGTRVSVRCQNPAGALVDTQYTMSYLTNL